jgi:general nucleoside transport system permease protein
VSDFFDIFLLKTVLELSTPLILAALGGLLSERSGVINIALEGLMLIGAFFSVVGVYYFDNPWLGLAVGLLAAMVGATIHAVWCITFRADQIVAATAINLVAGGITIFLMQRIWSQSGQTTQVQKLPEIWGTVSILTPVAFVSVAIVAFILYRTKPGLRLQAAGEHPKAAESVGINVTRYRYACVIASGFFGGLGGAYLSIGELAFFTRDMTQGRGFIALAAVIFGNWTPLGALLACILFAGSQALQIQAQATGMGISSDLLLALPYVLTLVAIAGFVRRSRPPAGLGRHASD